VRHPESVDVATVRKVLKPHLTRSPLTIRPTRKTHERIFAVQTLARCGKTAQQIANELGLDDERCRGREYVAELNAAYRDMISRFELPALPHVR
jgi:hypothetical protein